MGEYLSPGVYVESTTSSGVSIESVSSSTGGFVGKTQRGPLDRAVLVTSWNSYLNNFAYGMSSPFLTDSDLAYSVYGFFQNGGSRCYVKRVAHYNSTDGKFTCVPAKVTAGALKVANFEAKDAGAWGNKLKLSGITANPDDDATKFDLSVSYGGEVVESYKSVSNAVDTEDYWIDVINANSNYIKAVTGELEVVAEESTFSGGADHAEGSSDIVDADYELALQSFNSVEDVNLMCIPGQTSTGVNTALISYCENRGDIFAILDAPKASTVESVKALRKTLSCKVGSLNFPWIKVTDPLSKTGKLRDCPTCGHLMGVYARTISERGEWKAPAGVEATIRGAVEVMLDVSEYLDILNPLGIVSIVPKTNYGIVAWGARSISPDSSMKYISDILLDINIKKSIKQGTQWVVFEPHDASLWRRVSTTIEDFLFGKWQDGALLGEAPEQAYFVKCDEDLNPQAIRDAGKLICEVGYARKRPAEFVIFRVSHELASN